ncbi:MAG: SWIM zinc finger family protein, partial [bacterium]
MTRAPITHKILINWAGQRVFQDAKALMDRGMVQDAAYEEPFVVGTVLWSNRPLKTSVRILHDGSAENHCPCRDSKERGIICSHVVALCLELIRRANNPEMEAKRQEELRRAERIAKFNEAAYVKRARNGTPGSTDAHIRLTLKSGWRRDVLNQRIPIRCDAVIGEKVIPLSNIPPMMSLGLNQKDESVLFVLEDICEGPAKSEIDLKPQDFVSLLQLLQGHQIDEEQNPVPITIAATKLTSFLHLDLDRDNGELILMIHTEIPFLNATEIPLYIVAGRHGWVFGANHFWPLEQILPDPIRSIYVEPVIIPRTSVPRFMQAELPMLAGFMRVESDLSLELFPIEPAQPKFRFVIKGSPASLAGTLYAEYNGYKMVSAKNDPKGHFAIPDPNDFLRYLVRNLEAEKKATEFLSKYGFTGEAGDALTPVVGCREVLNFLGSHVPALRRKGWRIELEGRIGGFMEEAEFATPVVHINYKDEETGWFEVG